MVDVANSEFFYSNVKSITTDFTVSPYYDDYDGKNNYYKILFKPGYAVQARELTQIQSMLQEQINRFGQHIFTEGSMVLGGKFFLDKRVNYVKVKDFDVLDNPVDITVFKDQIVTGQTTGIRAYVNLVLDGTDGTDTPKTLYVSYLSGNPTTGEIVFSADEPLVSNVGTLIVGNTVPVGFGSVFTINEGIRFAKEHFIYHSKQSVVVDRYDINPTCKVGFMLEESIVNASEDSSLLDPALESSNYSAPGADRFKINPVLTRLEIDDTAGFPDYVNLFAIQNGQVTELNERPIYNVIRHVMARRTMDESGHYYVRGFNPVLEEHLDTGNNGGAYSEERGGNSQLLRLKIDTGTGYVKGYEINTLEPALIEVPKSTAFSNVNGQVISTGVGSYVVVNEATGAWNINSGQLIDLYDTAQQRISRGVSSTASQTGNKIGTARVKSISRDSGSLGTPSGSIRVHLFDVSMLGSNSFSSVKSVFYNNSTSANVGADIVLQNGVAKLQAPYAGLLYYVGSDHTKMIRSPDGTVDTTFFFKKTTDVSIVSAGTFSLSSSIPNEIFPYGTSTLSAADKVDIFLNLNESFNIALPGSVLSGGGASNTVTGSSTFFTRLNVGDKIELSGNTKTYVIASIANNTSLTVTSALPSVMSTNTIYKAYKSGDMIDLNGVGSADGVTRSVLATSTSLSFDLKENLGGTRSGTVTYTMARSGAREVRKVLKRNRYVLIDCATNPGGNTGPYCLGFSDVYVVNSIRKAPSFSAVTDGTDVSADFYVDNGQRDNSYRNASIIPEKLLTPADKLLVCLDYFQPDYTLGVGYFSIDSYPVNDVGTLSDQITTEQIPIYKSPDTGAGFNLRNHFDFRPVYTNTADDATSLSGITTNPTVSDTLQYESAGLRLPADSETILYDYSYYLPRKDIVTLNENGDFMLTKGVPAVVPVTPACPSHLMPIARLYISPYPSLSPYYARLIGRNDLACSSAKTSQIRYTMKDIGVLKQRIDNLENYVSLSLLEKSAMDMKFLDENGLDRFKNGIFVDSFTSFMLSDISNPDHRICYDPKEGSIRPYYETQAIGYNLNSGSNVVVKNNLLMLPYTEVAALTQPYATTFRNVETTVFRFVGKLYLDPDSDYWVNTSRLAAQTLNFGATDADLTPYSIVYGSYQTVVTGVTVSDPILLSQSGSVSGGGTGSVTSSKRYFIGPFAAEYARGQFGVEMGASGVGGIATTAEALIAQYGADTPISITGKVNGGALIDIDLEDYSPYGSPFTFNVLKTLGDLTNPQYTQLVNALATYEITINTTEQVGQTISQTNNYSQVVSTGTQASRAYTEVFQTLKTETQSIGDKVVNVAPIADIRPQTVGFEARGLKASTRHYVYFDGDLMSSYVTPATSNNTILGANTNASFFSATGAEGSALYTNANGIAYGFLRIPSDSVKSFRTGTKEVIVTDSPTNEPDCTSSAKAYFAAQGITQTLQETIISTGHIVTETKSGIQTDPIVYSNTTNNYSITTNTTIQGSNTTSGVLRDIASCMAYSFKLNTPRGEEGTFLTSVDLFFAGKDPNLGVWFEIRAMNDAGGITKVQVPDSEVWLESSQINISEDGSIATKVEFKSPIFLLNNQEYAFVIHTVGINPNYYMFVSVLGQNDILTKQPVNSRPLTGTLYTTNNNTDWDIVPRVDLKCTFNRAKFQTGVVGEAILGNEYREYIQLPLTPRTGANTSWFGDRLVGNDVLNLSTPTDTISAGDYIVGANSGANARVSTIEGSSYTMTDYSKINLRFEVGETLTIVRSNGYVTTIGTTVVSKNTAEAEIYSVVPKNDPSQFNGNSALLILTKTNGLFRANDTFSLLLSGNTVSTK